MKHIAEVSKPSRDFSLSIMRTAHRLRAGVVAAFLFAFLTVWHAVPARAQNGPTLSLPSPLPSGVTSQYISDLFGGYGSWQYFMTPGTVLPLSGSGFSSSDTSVNLYGVPSDVNSGITCNMANGAFSCNFLVTDVPSANTGNNSRIHLTAQGEPEGDTATLIINVDPGVGIYPTSGPPGTTVTVYGTGYLSAKGPLFDSTTAITLGPDQPSGVTGTGPELVYNNIPSAYSCTAAKDGSLSDYGPCTFTVPGFLPGTYNLGVLVALDYSTPDTLACLNAWCVVPFTITPPTISVSPEESKPGSTLIVTSSNFAGTDTSATIAIDGIIATPSSGCSIAQNGSGGSFTCSVTVPTSDTAPGPHSVHVAALPYGDSGDTQFVIPGQYPLTLSSTQAAPGSSVTVKGSAFDPSDTSATINFGATNVTPSSGCPITSGTLSCSFTVPANAIATQYDLQVTGNAAGDYDLATLTVVASLALSPVSSTVGSQVAISGVGINFSADSVSATFNGQSLPLLMQSGPLPSGILPPAQTGTTCAAENGTFPLRGFTCSFVVPASATPTPANSSSGNNTIAITDSFGDTASATFSLLPAVSLAQTQGSVGQQIPVTGSGFPQGAAATFSMDSGTAVTASVPNSPSSGSFSGSITVPNVLPGEHTLSAFISGSSNNQPISTAAFKVVPSLLPSVGSAAAGSVVTVNAGGFPPSNTGILLSLNNVSLPTSGCTSSFNSPTESFSCTFTVPDLSAGNYQMKAVGNTTGDTGVANFGVTALSIFPPYGYPSQAIQVQGVGFPNDTSITFTIGGESPVSVVDEWKSQSGSCSVRFGSFSCQIQPPVLSGGMQPVVATGNTGDQATASFQVKPLITISGQTVGFNSDAAGPAGSTITVQGNGFLASDASVTISFHGGNESVTCPVSEGSFSCSSLIVPSGLPEDIYEVSVTGSSGLQGDYAFGFFDINPGITLSAGQGAVGATITVTGNNFLSSDTSATLMFGFGANNSVAVGPASGCFVGAGNLGSCSFVVPATLPSGPVTARSGYTLFVNGNIGDQGSVPFTVLSGPPSGTYKITNVKSGLVLGVLGASTSEGANVVQWSAGTSPDQVWNLTLLANGAYQITDLNSGMVLGVPGASTSTGATLVQWPSDGGPDQEWQFTQNGSNWTITNVNSGLQLDIQGGSTAAGAQAFQWPSDGATSQQWTFTQLPSLPASGKYQIKNLNSGLLIGVLGASTSEGANVVQWNSDGSLDQKWNLTTFAVGSYVITDVNSGLVIGVQGGSTNQGATLIQWPWNTVANQEWNISANGPNWTITNVNSGLLMDIQSGATSAGAQAFQWANDGGNSQQWVLIPIQ
jgi:hypothetical protein